MFNGYVMVWFEFEHLPAMALSLSATLYAGELWWNRRSAFAFLALVGALALSVCVSHVQLLIYQLLFVGLHQTIRWFRTARDASAPMFRSLRPLLAVAAAFLVAFSISANFFTTHLELLRSGHRESIPYDQLFSRTGQLPPKYLSTLLFPDLFGNPALGRSYTPRTEGPQPYNNYSELCIYSGVVSLFLALICIPYFARRRYLSFYLAVAAACMAMAMGSLIYYPLARLVPGLSLSTPTRILYLFGFAVSMLAAMGADILLSRTSRGSLALMVGLTTILAAVYGFACFIQSDAGFVWALGSMSQGGWSGIWHGASGSSILSPPFLLQPLLLATSTVAALALTICSRGRMGRTVGLALALGILAYDLSSFARTYNTSTPRSLEFPATDAIEFLQRDKTKFRVPRCTRGATARPTT
jgi:hypothetical protein